MFKDSQIVCDSCQATITRMTGAPAEGYPNLHALCAACFAQTWSKQ